MIKALIFDFDGLLFDTGHAWDEAFVDFLRAHNISDQPEITDKMAGMGLREAIEIMIEKMGLVGDLNELVSEYRKMFYQFFLKEKNILMFGALGILEKAKEKGLIIAMTSGGHTKDKLVEILKLHDVYKYFSVIISSDDVFRGKPAPDVYLEALKELNLDAAFCLALEDSSNGVESARAAGICVYGVNSDEKTRNDLTMAGAASVFVDLTKIEL